MSHDLLDLVHAAAFASQRRACSYGHGLGCCYHAVTSSQDVVLGDDGTTAGVSAVHLERYLVRVVLYVYVVTTHYATLGKGRSSGYVGRWVCWKISFFY